MAPTQTPPTPAVPLPPDSRSAGLYDPTYEHDACGVGLVADLSGKRTHSTVAQALTVLRHLDHRGAKGSDPDTGDGAGILTQLPDTFFRAVVEFEPDASAFDHIGLIQDLEELLGRRVDVATSSTLHWIIRPQALLEAVPL